MIDELNTSGNDESAFPLPGDLQLVFTSERLGSRDIFRVTRSAIGQPFAAPTPIDELNTSWEESDLWVSRDGRMVFFSSNRGDGNSEIYQATAI